MKNITAFVSDKTYRDARIWAAENDTSVSTAVQLMLQNIGNIFRFKNPSAANPQQQATNSNTGCETVSQTNQP